SNFRIVYDCMRRYPSKMPHVCVRAATALVLVAGLTPAMIVRGADRLPDVAAPPTAVAPAPPLPAPRKRARRHAARAANVAPVPGPAPAGAAPAGADKEFNWCHKVPAGQRSVKVNLKPDAELAEVVGWISSITCKEFVLSAATTIGGKKVTIVAPALITPEEAYRVFLDALDSAGLTVQPDGKFLKIIEVAKAKSGAIPLYGWDGRPLSAR